ncbi:MAG: 1,4-alpha-glucan branching protein domain-containing protein [Candidatus Nanopelagicales bacterium]|nr:1,4-alpha-glucan branching protein domain-containing protein [Candidatus Nanopelagicales bacterium]
MTAAPIGTFCLVLHTHLPWLVGHGSWPVGEEWLHQAWSGSYAPLFDLLERLAEKGRSDLVTLGVTPILAAQLDDPRCLQAQHTWLSDWYWRAVGLSRNRDQNKRALGAWEAERAHEALARFERDWSHGGSPVLRRLIDSRTVELLTGPATHPFLPLVRPEVASFALSTGLDDATIRFGSRPDGMWAPECGYRPGLADLYSDIGISHFVMDGPSFRHVGAGTELAHPIADTGVIAFGRDLDVTYRVWSPRRGYPGGRWYRDFHTFDHEWGFRHSRVTSTRTAPDDKAPYNPARAAAAVEADAIDFVRTVRNRLRAIRDANDGRAGLTVAAYDTELFGHWWAEGPQWLERVLELLPEAGVRVTTLRGALSHGLVGEPIDPESGSWGAGKDWHIWDGEMVHAMVADNNTAQGRALDLLKRLDANCGRTVAADQLVRDLLLALGSDWAFMSSHGSASQYARDRHAGHHADFAALADLVDDVGWDDPATKALSDRQRVADGPFGHLNAQLLA